MAHEPRRKAVATSKQPAEHKHMDKGEAQKHGPSTRKGQNETNPRTISTRELVGSEEWRLESTPSPARSGVEAGENRQQEGEEGSARGG
jgi:hypothetical protein